MLRKEQRDWQAGATCRFQDTQQPIHMYPTECRSSHRTCLVVRKGERQSRYHLFVRCKAWHSQLEGCGEGKLAGGNTPGLPR